MNILIVMEIVEEKNPLQYTGASNNVPNNFKNSVGRPKKIREIKFSPLPKSIVSILLCKEKTKADDGRQINIIKQTGSTNEDILKRTQNNKSVCCAQSLKLPKDKLYECSHVNCTYSTRFPCNLKSHQRTHTTEQQYICDECTFRSKFISSLKTHKRLHRNERPFACQSCDYKCNSQSNLKKHITRKHFQVNNDK